MRLLIDDSLPWQFRALLIGHDAVTTAYMGWKGKSNGELLKLAASDFDVFITADRSIPYQQCITETDVAVVVVIADSNAIESLRPLAPLIVDALDTIRRGEIVHIGIR